MALILEDGTGLATANAYSNYTKFKEYHDARGNDYVDGLGCIEEAIIRATDYLDMMFNYRGYRIGTTQGLEFPRAGARYDDGRVIINVPKEIEQACNEYALRGMSASLAPDPAYSSSGAPAVESTKRIGSLSKSEKLANSGFAVEIRSYPLADRLLTQLITNGQYVERA